MHPALDRAMISAFAREPENIGITPHVGSGTSQCRPVRARHAGAAGGSWVKSAEVVYDV
jgi:hypothetical protein